MTDIYPRGIHLSEFGDSASVEFLFFRARRLVRAFGVKHLEQKLPSSNPASSSPKLAVELHVSPARPFRSLTESLNVGSHRKQKGIRLKGNARMRTPGVPHLHLMPRSSPKRPIRSPKQAFVLLSGYESVPVKDTRILGFGFRAAELAVEGPSWRAC